MSDKKVTKLFGFDLLLPAGTDVSFEKAEGTDFGKVPDIIFSPEDFVAGIGGGTSSADIQAISDGVDANQEDISELKAQVETNTESIETLWTSVNGNAATGASNSQRISVLEASQAGE